MKLIAFALHEMTRSMEEYMRYSHRKHLAGTAVAIALALPTAVFAGGKMAPMEPVVVTPAPAPMTQPMTWTGFYGGLGIGYGRGASNTGMSTIDGLSFIDGTPDVSFNPSVSGFIGSARLGYDVQHGNFVFGGLIEGSLGKISGSSQTTLTIDGEISNVRLESSCEGNGSCKGSPNKGSPIIESEDITLHARASYSNLMSVALRAGPLINDGNTLLYGRLGLSRAKLTVNLPDSVSGSSTGSGLNAGLGVEHRLNSNISVFAEYNYHDVGKNFTVSSEGTDWSVRGKALHTVNMGLNFRF